jgi:histidinol dehydrogenase
MSPPRRVRLRAGGTQAIAHTLRPELDAAGVEEAVAGTLREVRARGDDALVDGARRFDCPGFTHDRLRVPRAAIDRAVDALSEELRTAIVTAASQVRVVAEALLPDDRAVTLPYGQRVQVRQVPVDAAGCYAPGGRAAYPSSLVMGVVPAQVAGVGRIVAVP